LLAPKNQIMHLVQRPHLCEIGKIETQDVEARTKEEILQPEEVGLLKII